MSGEELANERKQECKEQVVCGCEMEGEVVSEMQPEVASGMQREVASRMQTEVVNWCGKDVGKLIDGKLVVTSERWVPS